MVLVIIGAGPHMALADGRERRLAFLALLLLHLVLLGGAVAALAVVPAVAGGLLFGLVHPLDGAVTVQTLAAVKGIKLILLDNVDELGGIIHILGIAAVAQALRPAAVVGDVKLIEDAVARALEELGMIQERVLGSAVLAVAHLFQGVATAIHLALPVIGLDAEVVVGLHGHLALTHIALEQALGQSDAGGHAILARRLHRHLLVALDIVQILLMFSLRRRRKGPK